VKAIGSNVTGVPEFILTTARDEDVSTLSDEELCCG
jgi:hypothetical protein